MFHIEERLVEIVRPTEPKTHIISFEVIFNILSTFLFLEVLCEI